MELKGDNFVGDLNGGKLYPRPKRMGVRAGGPGVGGGRVGGREWGGLLGYAEGRVEEPTQ